MLEPVAKVPGKHTVPTEPLSLFVDHLSTFVTPNGGDSKWIGGLPSRRSVPAQHQYYVASPYQGEDEMSAQIFAACSCS